MSRVLYNPGTTFKPAPTFKPVAVTTPAPATATEQVAPAAVSAQTGALTPAITPEKVVPLAWIVGIGLLVWWLSSRKGGE